MDILGLLDSQGISYEHKGQGEVAISCPNAFAHSGGIDKTPSFFINVEKMVAHCWVCGYKMGEVGLTKWLMGEDLDEFQIKAISIKSKLKQLKSTEDELYEVDKVFFEPPGVPFNRDYRGISAETYRKLGAIECTRGRYEGRICFPIVQESKTLGYDCRTLSDQVPKYLRPKGCDAKRWLYPYDRANEAKVKRVILCEGIFHSINTYDKLGIPEALCYFGAKNFDPVFNIQLLLGLDVDSVIVFPDNDEPGWNAAIEIYKQIEPWLPVRIANVEKLEEGKDLGDLTRDEILDVLKDLRRLR